MEPMAQHAPATWPRMRLGQVFNERKTKVSDKDYPPLSVTMKGIVPQLDTAAKTDDGDNRKLVLEGDYVINSRSDRKGSGGISDRDGSVSLISIVLEPDGIDHRFAHNLLRSVVFQEEFYRWGSGIVADLWSTRYTDMKNIRLAVPPRKEQQIIAAYLDRETGRIDALVARLERLNVLLTEKRQAVISHAVTKGLNPDAPMKDSGIDWLGEIPAHWEVKRVKHCIHGIEQGWSPDCEARTKEGAEWGVLKVGCVNGWTFNPLENKTLPAELTPRPQYEVRRDDLLMSRANTKDLVGSVALVEDTPERLMLCDKLYRVDLDRRLADPAFALYFLRSSEVRSQFELHSSGASSTMQNIGQGVIKNLFVGLPPMEEQLTIVANIVEFLAHTEVALASIEALIERAKERLSATISAAVTGQIPLADMTEEDAA